MNSQRECRRRQQRSKGWVQLRVDVANPVNATKPNMPKTQTKRRQTLEVIKGNLTPLSPQQRELVCIFVEHLRHLPKWRANSFESADYLDVNRLLTTHYRRKHPHLHFKNVGELPEDDCAKFHELMEYASSASAEDPRIVRRAELLELAQDKNNLMWFARRYESERVRLGLPEEGLVPSLLMSVTKEPEPPQDGCA
jgi:hypothetical protein